jgi:hypothetical protein
MAVILICFMKLPCRIPRPAGGVFCRWFVGKMIRAVMALEPLQADLQECKEIGKERLMAELPVSGFFTDSGCSRSDSGH